MPASSQSLAIDPLSAESFSSFGDVIETAGRDWLPINNGSTQRFDDLAKLQADGKEARMIMSIFRAQPLQLPLTIQMLERHPFGSQAFIPLDQQQFLLVVAPASPTPEISEIRAFITNGKQGVNYHKGVWHHPIIAIDKQSDFLVVDRSGKESNCDEVYFPTETHLILPKPS